MLPFMFSELEKIFSRLIHLIFKQEKLTIPITEKIKKKWLIDKNNHLEHDALVDISAATKVPLKGLQLLEEKKNKFRGQCRTMALDILVKLAFTERGFSVNKEVVDYNMEEKSLTS